MRAPSHTTARALDAMVKASLPALQPPPHVMLRDGDLPFWSGIIASRARDEWTDSDLVVAAQLARCQRDIEDEQKTLDAETTVIENGRGTMVTNPRVMVMEQLARREMALMRTLRMGGRVAGDARDQSGSRRLQSESRRALEELDADGLLA